MRRDQEKGGGAAYEDLADEKSLPENHGGDIPNQAAEWVVPSLLLQGDVGCSRSNKVRTGVIARV
jgi:hypothetical protein